MKQFTRYFTFAFFVTFLTACVNTASLNQEAARSFAQVKHKAAQAGLIDHDSRTARRIHAVFQQMKPYAEQANRTGVPFAWEIVVLKDKELNAWAMPGGKMAFYTGLVERLALTDEEIAVVMGHEMAHALQEHAKSDRTLNVVTGIAAELGKVALASQGISSNVLGYDAVDLIAEYGLNKPFSRSQETEADEVGLMLMARAGFNPESAPNVWAKMSQASGAVGGLIGSILSTHPTNADRQKNLQRLVPKAREIYLANKRF